MSHKNNLDEISLEEDISVEPYEESNDQPHTIEHVAYNNKFQDWCDRHVLIYWNGLSKRQKTVSIIAVTGLILLVLIIAILIPLTITSSQTRYYYIQAVEVNWNYVPQGKNVVQGRGFNSHEKEYTENKPKRIGNVYKKATFYGYTDANFTTRLDTSPEEQHLGLLGPIVRAEVGETVIVVVKNSLSHNISFHVNGLQYTKASEGISYADNSTQLGDNIPPGESYTYRFEIADTDGPASSDLSSVAYTYYSTIDEVGDFNAGLAGMVVITKKGGGDQKAKPLDVDSELFLLPAIFDENNSNYFCENLHEYLPSIANVTLPCDSDDDDAVYPDTYNYMEGDQFIESNRKYSINGYLFGNMPEIQVLKGTRCRWYIAGLGEGTHTILWSGQSLVSGSSRLGSIVIFPGTTVVADMVPMIAGIWLIESYGLEAEKGMSTLYQVIEAGSV